MGNFDNWFCAVCKVSRILLEDNISHACPNCGDVVFFDDYCRLSFVDRTQMATKKPCYYKRNSYFDTILDRLQSRQYHDISHYLNDEELNKIREIMGANRDLASLKIVLKKLKLSKNNKFGTNILNKLYGIPNIELSFKERDELKQLFEAIQEPYEIGKQHHRKNFMSYNFVFGKLFKMIGRDEISALFPQSKNVELNIRNEIMWSSICNKLGWSK